MKKIRITFKISQRLSGEIKTVNIVGFSVTDCWNRIHTALNDKEHRSFSVCVLNVTDCEQWTPVGIWQADSQVVVCVKGAASLIPGAAALPVCEPHQNN